jgi:hypothetical protein
MTDAQAPARCGFVSDRLADEHLCDHVLTRPEAHDWALLIPDYRTHADPTDDGALRRLAASLFTEAPLRAALALREQYVTAILGAINDALRLGWRWERWDGSDRHWVGLGLDGIMVFWDRRAIRSGYLPRSSSLAPLGPAVPRAVEPLPRRNPDRRLGRPPADTPANRHALLESTFHSVSRLYETACDNQEVIAWRSSAFAQRPPRLGKWQQLLAGRPSGEVGSERNADAATQSESA